MTKQELEQYRSIVAEIDETREKIRNNTVSDTVVGSSAHFPYTSHVIGIGGDDNAEAAMRDRAHLARLSKEKNKIEDFINAIPDSLTRRIFKLRYTKPRPDGKTKPLSWQWIASQIHSTDESTPRKIHNKFLKLSEFSEKSML